MVYGNLSGIAITNVRVKNFRSLANIEVPLNDLTVLIGANNAGKTSFLDALYAAIGAGKKNLGLDDVRLAPGEVVAPKDRMTLIDIKLHPVSDDGTILPSYPDDSFWNGLWGSEGIVFDNDSNELTILRTSLSWDERKGDYVVKRTFLKEWRVFDDWDRAERSEKELSAVQLDAIALHYVNAGRDLDNELQKAGSFWRRLTDDLGLSEGEIIAAEELLVDVNRKIVEKSKILRHLKDNLAGLQSLVSAEGGTVDITPVAKRIRDLSNGVNVSLNTTANQSFPLARHGMGTRSLASLLVFRAYASWRNKQATNGSAKVHSVLALEEPESHLHPQAQRSLFAHINEIPGQRVVSTHSPYFAGQASLSDLRLFIKRNGDTTVNRLNLELLTDKNDVRKIKETVIETRGDILFSRGIVLFEGQTEEQALPIWAERYWGSTIHELGLCFVRANGTDYFPFIWLAKALEIPWFIFADGEELPVKNLNAALKKAGEGKAESCPNIVVQTSGRNFESQLLFEGYLAEIEVALNEMNDSTDALDEFIETMHGKPGKKGVLRDYQSEGGRGRAALDAMSGAKTSISKHIASVISSLSDEERRFPIKIKELFHLLDDAYNLKQFEEEK